MEEKEILERMQHVFTRVFGKSVQPPGMATSPPDVEQWNSLNHVMLIAETEKEFDIKFDLDDMMDFQNVGDIVAGIIRKKK